MKPEELDELFRRGLAEQNLPPRAQAWDSIQQRLRAPIGEEDELPAFLRQSPPSPAPMTASRGGAGSLTISWYQRPVWRAAAVAVLAVGTLLAQHQLSQHAAKPADTPAPLALATAPDRQPATQPTLLPDPEPVAAPQPAAHQAIAREPAQPAATPSPEPSFPQEPVGLALAAVDVTPDLIHEHLLCPDRRCSDCDLIEQKIGPARFRSLRADAARELMARNGVRSPRPASDGFALASASRPSRRAFVPGPAARPHAQPVPEVAPAPAAPAPDAFTDALAEAPAPEALPGSEVTVAGQPAEESPETQTAQLATRTEERSGTGVRPRDVLRRASERMRSLLDGADHTNDGRLTIEKRVAGRPVRKTISL